MSGRNKDSQGQIEDYGKLIIGEPQIYQALENISKADIRIAVMHHPFEWIMETDRNRTGDRLRKGVHFILYGHQHNVTTHDDPAKCVRISSGWPLKGQ